MLTRLERLYVFYTKEQVILIVPWFATASIWTHYFTHCFILIWSLGIWKYTAYWKFHNEFIRRITNLKKSTPFYLLHAELGHRTVEINIKSRMIGFWVWLVNGKETKHSKVLYKKMLRDYNAGTDEHKWMRCSRDILVSVGRLDLFHKSVIDNPRSVKMSISSRQECPQNSGFDRPCTRRD